SAFSAELANDRIEIPNPVRWTIARALGAIGQGLLRQPTNQVADQIEAHIKHYIDAQKANHAIKRERLGDMKTAYDFAAAETKDEDERMRKAHAYAFEAAKHEIDSLAKVADNTRALAKAAEMKALLSEKQAQYEEKETAVGVAAAGRDIDRHVWVPA